MTDAGHALGSATADEVRAALAAIADPERAAGAARYFQTGPGQYAEGDVFIGVTVPQTRAVVTQFSTLGLSETERLLAGPVHEHRLAALLILVAQFARAPRAPATIPGAGFLPSSISRSCGPAG